MIDRVITWCLRHIGPRRLARSVKREMEAHIAEETESLMAAGRSRSDAEREARLRFGDLGKHQRAAHVAYGIHPGRRPGTAFIDAVRFEVVHSVRSLRQRPGWTALAVLTLALGIGGNTALFSVLNATLFAPLPYPEADRVFFVWSGEAPADASASSYPDIADWRDQTTTLAHLVPYNIAMRTFADGTEPERILGAVVDEGFFDALGVRPQLGRTFAPDDMIEGADPVVILDHRFWERRYGADPQIVGKTINDGAFRVVGVMPEGFEHPEPYWDDASTDYWLPLVGSRYTNRASRFLRAIGRLHDGATREDAQAELTAIAARLRTEYPQDAASGVWLRSLREEFAGDARRPLVLLAGAAGFVLLIACANVAHLLLTRALERGGEFAVRLALGATRGALLRLQLIEGMVLALGGAVVGIAAATPLAEFLSALGPAAMPGFQGATADRTVLLFAVAATLFTGVATSVLPGLAGMNRMAPPGAQGRSSASRSSRRSRQLLIFGEVVLAVPLLVGAAVLVQSLSQLSAQDLGFRRDGVLTLRLTTPLRDEEAQHFFDEIVDGLEALPRVSYVGAVSSIPLDGLNYTGGRFVSDTGLATEEEPVYAATRWVSRDYFAALEIPLLAGQHLEDSSPDDAAVVSAGFARALWGDPDAVGRRMRAPRTDPADEPQWHTVIGVVADVNERGPEFEPDRMVFLPASNGGWNSMGLVLRTQDAGADVAATVRATVGRIAPQVPITSFAWMEDRLDGRLSGRRFRALLLGGFATLGLALAAIGMFGVVSHAVQRRVHEIGIRMALGARARDVTVLVVGEMALLVAAGVTVGLVLAVAVQRVAGHLVAGLETMPPAIAAGAAAFLAGIALLSAYLPARRAARVDPLTALRHG